MSPLSFLTSCFRPASQAANSGEERTAAPSNSNQKVAWERRIAEFVPILAAAMDSETLETAVDQLCDSELIREAAKSWPDEFETYLFNALRRTSATDRSAASDWLKLQMREKSNANEYGATGRPFNPGPLIALLRERTTVTSADGDLGSADPQTRDAAQRAAVLGRVLNRMVPALPKVAEVDEPNQGSSFDGDAYNEALKSFLVHGIAKGVSDDDLVHFLEVAVDRGGASRALSEHDHERYHDAIRDVLVLLPANEFDRVASWLAKQREIANASRSQPRIGGNRKGDGEVALLGRVTRRYDQCVRELAKIEAAVNELQNGGEQFRGSVDVAARLRPLERTVRALSEVVTDRGNAATGGEPRLRKEKVHQFVQACELVDRTASQWSALFPEDGAQVLQALVDRTRTIIAGCHDARQMAEIVHDLADDVLLSLGALIEAVRRREEPGAAVKGIGLREPVGGSNSVGSSIVRLGDILTKMTLRLNAEAHLVAEDLTATLSDKADSWAAGLGAKSRKDREITGEPVTAFLDRLHMLSNVAKATGLQEEELRDLRARTADFLGKTAHLLSPDHLTQLRMCDGLGMPILSICDWAVGIQQTACRCLAAKSSQEMLSAMRDFANYAIGLQAALGPFVGEKAGGNDKHLAERINGYVKTVLERALAQLTWSERKRLEARINRSDWHHACEMAEQVADGTLEMPTSLWATNEIKHGIQLSMEILRSAMQTIEALLRRKPAPPGAGLASISSEESNVLRASFGIGIRREGEALRVDEMRDVQCFVIGGDGTPRRAILSDYQFTGAELSRLQNSALDPRTFTKGTAQVTHEGQVYTINKQLHSDAGRAVIRLGDLTLPMGAHAKEDSNLGPFVHALSGICTNAGVSLEAATALLGQTLPGSVAAELEGQPTLKGWFGLGRFVPGTAAISYEFGEGKRPDSASGEGNGRAELRPSLTIHVEQVDAMKKLILLMPDGDSVGEIEPDSVFSSRQISIHAELFAPPPFVGPNAKSEPIAVAEQLSDTQPLVTGNVAAHVKLQFVESSSRTNYPVVRPLPQYEALGDSGSSSQYSSFDAMLLLQDGRDLKASATALVNKAGRSPSSSRRAQLGKLPEGTT